MKKAGLVLVMFLLFSCSQENVNVEEYVNVTLTYDKYVVGFTTESMGRKSYADWKGHVFSATSPVEVELIGNNGEYELIKIMQTELATLRVNLRVGSTYDIFLWGQTPGLHQRFLTFDGKALGVLVTEGMSNIVLKCETVQTLILVDDTGIKLDYFVSFYAPTIPFTLPVGSYQAIQMTSAARKDGFYYDYVITEEIDGHDISWMDYEVKFKTLDGVLKSIFIIDPKRDTVYLIYAEESKLSGTGITNDFSGLLDTLVEVGVK